MASARKRFRIRWRSPWADAITWPSLEAAIAAVASPAFRDEVGGLVTRARALASDEGR